MRSGDFLCLLLASCPIKKREKNIGALPPQGFHLCKLYVFIIFYFTLGKADILSLVAPIGMRVIGVVSSAT